MCDYVVWKPDTRRGRGIEGGGRGGGCARARRLLWKAGCRPPNRMDMDYMLVVLFSMWGFVAVVVLCRAALCFDIFFNIVFIGFEKGYKSGPSISRDKKKQKMVLILTEWNFFEKNRAPLFTCRY